MKFQSIAIDVVQAYAMVDFVEFILKDMRQESVSEFRKQFTEATTLGKKLHGDNFGLSKHRVTGRQAHRDDTPASSTKDYYRVTLYNEFLSHVISEIEVMFVEHPAHKLALGLLFFSPYQVCEPFS